MASRRPWGLVGLLVGMLVVVLITMAMTPPGRSAAVVAAAPTTTAPSPAPSSSVFDNPFLPEERNLSDCVSAVPKPGCGSEARGGWRQTLVFAVMVLGLGLIAWRIVRGVRRARLRA